MHLINLMPCVAVSELSFLSSLKTERVARKSIVPRNEPEQMCLTRAVQMPLDLFDLGPWVAEGRCSSADISLYCQGRDGRCNPGGHQGRHARPHFGELEVDLGWSGVRKDKGTVHEALITLMATDWPARHYLVHPTRLAQ